MAGNTVSEILRFQGVEIEKGNRMDVDYVVMPIVLLFFAVLVVWLAVRRLRSIPAKPFGRLRRIAEQIGLLLVMLLVVAAAASSLFNTVASHRFWAMHPPPGEIVEVNGHRMHIDCMGQGSPTVVLDSGWGNDSQVWRELQPQLAETTRVCSYDRAGYGWSDALPAPRDADHIASELHELLKKAQVTGPIVLMGHSIAGLYMRDYATRYPEDVAGMVLIDVSTPLQDENPVMKDGGSSRLRPLMFRAALILGIPRWLGMCTKIPKGYETFAGRYMGEDLCRIHYMDIDRELDSFNQSGHETVHTGPYGALPILIFSHDPAQVFSGHTPSAEQVSEQRAWSEMQEDLKRLSTRSRRIIAKGSSHNVHRDRSQLVVKEVRIFLDQIRGTAPEPSAYGTTVEE
ncbi:MAG TPA: alpha/beta hydrolase [Edaphobacter sp.]|jgi:pimeloyl-ACP methyl ester carboxylesterase|nr:alpha/beta hydrolase [Edaphobacter sp.]